MIQDSIFPIASRVVAVLICLAIVGYTGFLLFSQYRSQSELETFYLNSQLQDSDENATALGYFFSERSDDMVRLAESRELSLYFENRALGMSMEYGLSASLLDAEEAFKKFREKKKLDNKAIYSRILFFDASGGKLIEASEFLKSDSSFTKENIASYLVKQSKSPLIFAKGSAEESLITLSIPFAFKGNYGGQIIAQIPLAMVYQQFVQRSESTSIQPLRVLLYQRKYLYSPPSNNWLISPEKMQFPNRFENKIPYRFSVADKNGTRQTLKVFATPVKGTPFSLATIIQENQNTPSTSPKRWFIVTGGIGFIILAGAAIIIRTTLRNEVLKARLIEISIREKTIAEKNRSLIKLTTAVEQSANAVIITGTDGVIEYVNPCFTQLTGIPYEEALGNSLDIIEPESGLLEEFHNLLRSIGAGKQWSGELLKRIKGEERMYWLNITVAPVRNEQGDVLSCVAIAQDVTARKDIEEHVIYMNIELEQRVRERTSALEASHRKLEKAYNNLKEAQSQMLQQEKMASIGQLAAGIAHEINNPVGFVLSNLGTMRKYVERLLGFIAIQATATETMAARDPDGTPLLQELRKQRKAMKIDYIGEDIGQLVSESIDGGERVKRIVQNLKSFARLDETEWKESNLNEGVESTINIVWNELKYKASLKKEYGEIPVLNCNIGQLNQVFLNILINAVQSIEQRGEISVRTWCDDAYIYVAIADTGCGIPADKLHRIFEPFFTTKDIGKGTGLGLSISYDIVKKHGGEILVESEISRGTTFTIKLPFAVD